MSQSPSGEYSQPGPPVNAGYGQPVNAGYGQPVNAAYGQPVNAGYGQPVNAAYSQPGQPGYGRPPQHGYGPQPVPAPGQIVQKQNTCSCGVSMRKDGTNGHMGKEKFKGEIIMEICSKGLVKHILHIILHKSGIYI